MKIKYMRFLAVLLLLPALAGAEEVTDVVSSLQHRYRAISTMQAGFTQEVLTRGMKGAQTSMGRVWLKKPGKMRWEYSSPAGDLIVSDGKTVWIYQGDLNQVIEKEAGGAAARMATDFLSGVGGLDRDFEVTLAGSTGDAYLLSLLPREEQPGMRRLALEVDKTSFLIKRTVLTDHFGTETSVEFKDMKTDVPVPDRLFRFAPPGGASVVRP